MMSKMNAHEAISTVRAAAAKHYESSQPTQGAKLDAVADFISVLYQEHLESLWDLFGEYTYRKERDGIEYFTTNATSSAVYICNRLTKLGKLKHYPELGTGRVQFYTIIPKKEIPHD